MVKYLEAKVPCILGQRYIESNCSYTDYFDWCVHCTVVLFNCFVMYMCVYVWVCVCVGFVMCGCVMCGCVCICGFCNVWVCVYVGFVMCGCVYMWVL